MAHSQPDIGNLARRLLEHEAGGSTDPAATSAAVEKIFNSLNGDLANLLGSGGLTALVKRALNLATREHPLLAEVSVEQGGGRVFKGLAESFSAGSDDEAAAAAISLLAHLLGLLVLLLGDELGVQSVRRLWPDLASDTGGSTK